MKTGGKYGLSMPCVVCIAGPTASGKSAFALSLAKKLGGEIVNADALQVYADLQIISARPNLEDMAQAPHHLFGHIDGGERYSAGRWLEQAVPIIIDIMARGRVPIIIGGTGLYFKALLQGLAKVPQPSAQARANAQNILTEQGIGALRARAEQLDPAAAARILGDDPQRLLRVVEVAQSSGVSLSYWQAQTQPIIGKADWRGAVLTPPRDGLYERINARFDGMVESGGIDEVARLYARGLNPMLPAMKAIGVPQIISALNGEQSLETALETAKRETRRFAKRQFTWFRGQAADWPTLSSAQKQNQWAAQMKQRAIIEL